MIEVKVASNDPARLGVVKGVHTIIYAVMGTATIYVLFCGITGARGSLLVAAASLVAMEGVVFLGNGRRCPLTTLAQRYGDPKGYVGDTWFPERWTRYTFRMFGTAYVVGLVLIGTGYL